MATPRADSQAAADAAAAAAKAAATSFNPTALTGAVSSMLNAAQTGATTSKAAANAIAGTVSAPTQFTAAQSGTGLGSSATAAHAAQTAAQAANPAGPHQHYGLGVNGVSKLYWDAGWQAGPDGQPQKIGTVNAGGAGSSAAPIVTSAGATTASTITPGGNANANPGALQIITDALKAAGLGSLASKAWTMWNQGFDMNAIMDDPVNGIRASAEYKQNFPAMAALNAKGQGISEAAYLAKETADLELMKQYGIPSGIFDSKEYLGSLMTNNVTAQDLQQRLIAVQDTVNSYDANIKKYAADTYGLDSGHLMAWALDPSKALPLIQQQAQAMKIGGAALASGFGGGLGAGGELSTAQAEALGAANVTQAQAQQGFTNLAQMGQLAQELPGDTSGSVTNQQMINSQFGLSGTDTAAVKKVQAKRVAEYQQGGAFAAGAAGAGGLGVANSAS